MAKTLTQYIADTRRITRVMSTTPYSDAVMTDFINEAKDYISSLVPFALVHSYYSSKIGKAVFYIPKDVLSVLVCRIYPYGGSYLTATLNSADTTIQVNDASPFNDSGYVFIGDPPTWEIIKYTGKTSNTLTGCSRGQYGTTAQTWVYAPDVYTPVRQWEKGAKWLTVAPQTDVSVFNDAEWDYTPDDLKQGKIVPEAYGIRGGALVFDKPFYVNGFGNVLLHVLITPPDLVNGTDTVYGLPDAFERIIPVCAGMFVLKSLGGEDAMLRYNTLQEEFATLLNRLHNHVENTVRGAYGSVAVETYRQSTTTLQGKRR